jgi:outer membrane protein assembly factor BamB
MSGKNHINQFLAGLVAFSLFLPIGYFLASPEVAGETHYQPSSYWPMERGNAQRNGTSIFDINETEPNVLWDIDVAKMAGWNESRRISSTNLACVGEDGTIYLANAENVGAIYPNGTLKWTLGINDTPYMGPALGQNGDLYVGATPPVGQPNHYSAIFAIGQNGSIKWRLQLPEINIIMLLVDESNTIYASVYDYEAVDQFNITVTSYVLVAITPEGSIKWKYSLPIESEFGSVCIPAMAPDGTIRFQTESTLAAINKNGTTRWTYDLPSRKQWESNAPLVTENGTTLTICNQTLMAIDLEGRLLWTYVFQLSVDSYSRWLIYANNEIYLYSSGYPDFIAAIWDNGTPAWTISDNDFSSYGPVMSHNGIIILQHDDYRLEAIAANGTRLWSTDSLYTASSSTGPTEIIIGAKDRIYIRHDNQNQMSVSLIAVGYNNEQPTNPLQSNKILLGLVIILISTAIGVGGYVFWRRRK